MHHYSFQVHFKNEEYLGSKDEVRQYVRDALESWCRGGDPESLLWKIADGKVTVRHTKVDLRKSEEKANAYT